MSEIRDAIIDILRGAPFLRDYECADLADKILAAMAEPTQAMVNIAVRVPYGALTERVARTVWAEMIGEAGRK